MKKMWLLAVILACTVSALAQAKQSAEEKAIRDLAKAWEQAVLNKDLDKAVSFYADDATVLPYGASAATTPQQIREVWKGLLSLPGTTVSFGITKLEVSKSGDMAYDVGWTELKTIDAQGTATIEKGKYVVVWKKRNGQWKAVADIFNTDK